MAKKKKKKVMYKVRTKEKVADIEKKKEITKEEKFYWVRLAVGAVMGLLGVLVFKLVGWWMLLYMVLLLLGWPFIQSFLIFRLPYQKDKWDWKQILKTGIGGYFFTFMFVSTICFTLVSYPAWNDQLSNHADTYDIQIEGNIAYIADGKNGFVILDISNPNHRNLLGTYKIDDINVQKVVIQENLGFLADEIKGLLIFDISDSTNPLLISSFNLQSNIHSIFIDENIVYIALGESGLSILDISTPSSPELLNNFTEGIFNDVIVRNNTAYLADRNNGLVLANVTDPANPIIINSLNLEGQMHALDLVDTNVFMAAGDEGLHIINASVFEAPKLIGTYNTTANASDVLVNDNIAYVSNGVLGISFVDISNKSDPINSTNNILYNTIGFAKNIAIYNDYLIITDGDKGLTLIYIPEPPIEPDEIVTSGAKTIPFGWTWGILSIFTISIMIVISKKRKYI